MADEHPADRGRRRRRSLDPAERDDASLTWNPLVAWGAWMADRHAEDEAPPGWIVAAVLVGVPVLAIGTLVLLAVAWR